MFSRFKSFMSFDNKKSKEESKILSDELYEGFKSDFIFSVQYNNIMKKLLAFNLKQFVILRMIDSKEHSDELIRTNLEQYYILADEIDKDIKAYIKKMKESK